MDDVSGASTDELWDALGQVSGRDRVEVLFELAVRAHQQHDLVRAQFLLAEAENTARELGDQLQVALSQFHQGDLALQAQDHATARERFGEAAQGFLDTGADLQAARALVGLAETEQVAHNWQACLDAASQGLRFAQSEDAHGLCGDACFLQARSLYYLDREREALDTATRAREYFRSCGQPHLVARVDDFTIGVALYLGEVDRALELAQGALVLTRDASGQDDPDTLTRLAEVHNRRGDPWDALRCADMARSSHRERGNLSGVARCEMVRGEALFELDRAEESLTAFVEARVLFDGSGWDSEALYAQVRQAIVLHRLERFMDAARLNRELVDRFRTQPDGDVSARWCVVRLLDNLLEAGEFARLLTTSEDLVDVWPEGVGVEERTFRDCQGFRAAALEELGQAQEAADLAAEVIAATPARHASVSTALCYEIRSRSRAATDEAAAVQDLAHAIALHVARGKTPRARELSDHFLAVDEAGSKPGQFDGPR